jgi:steroid 5-alpha reductase family enzyme
MSADSYKNNKPAGILIITCIYIVAACIGLWAYVLMPFAFWLKLLLADCIATVFVFMFSLAFNNASVYDPYWSVQPIVIITFFSLFYDVTSASLLLLISIVYWGIRLTCNWAYTFGGLGHQDWRYTKIKNENGRLYPLLNFAGIHMMPTLIVFACTLPAVFVLRQELNANIGSIIGACVCIGAATLQLVADIQMHKYRKSGQHGLIRTGLWKHSRHPNYLGEILMWWGVAIQAVSVMPERWWLIAGAVANTVMFFTVSIPMADKRQSSKPGYSEYKAATRSLLPLPRLSGKRIE